jgi:hypothetical protein
MNSTDNIRASIAEELDRKNKSSDVKRKAHNI